MDLPPPLTLKSFKKHDVSIPYIKLLEKTLQLHFRVFVMEWSHRQTANLLLAVSNSLLSFLISWGEECSLGGQASTSRNLQIFAKNPFLIPVIEVPSELSNIQTILPIHAKSYSYSKLSLKVLEGGRTS